jgi:hypothetical protein
VRRDVQFERAVTGRLGGSASDGRGFEKGDAVFNLRAEVIQ